MASSAKDVGLVVEERGPLVSGLSSAEAGTTFDPGIDTPRVSHAVLLTATQVVKWSLRVVFVLLVARSLGPARFGTYALLYTLAEFLAVASGTGYIDYLTREAAKDPRVGWGLAFQLVVLRMAIAVPVALIEIAILWVMGYPGTVLVGTTLLAVTIVPRALSEAVQGVLRGLQRYKSYLVIDVVLGAVLIAGAGLLFVRHGGLRMAIATEIAAAGIAGLVAVGLGLKFKTREVIGLRVWDLVKKGGVFNLYSFVGSLYDKFDVVLLSKLAGGFATGIYSVAYRALGVPQILAYGVFYSLLPELSRNAKGSEERRRMEKATDVLLSAAYLIVLATIVFAGPAVLLILGPQYAESAEALKILVWAVIFRYLNYPLNIALLAAGRERVFVLTTLTCLGVNLVGNLTLIPRFGWRAAALMTIVTELALLAQNIFWIRRAVSKVAPPPEAVRTSVAFGVVVTTALAGGHLGSSVLVGTACLACFVAYLAWRGMFRHFAGIWSAVRVTGG